MNKLSLGLCVNHKLLWLTYVEFLSTRLINSEKTFANAFHKFQINKQKLKARNSLKHKLR